MRKYVIEQLLKQGFKVKGTNFPEEYLMTQNLASSNITGIIEEIANSIPNKKEFKTIHSFNYNVCVIEDIPLIKWTVRTNIHINKGILR